MSKQFSAQVIREAAKLSTKILREIYNATEIGVTPKQLNDLAGKLCVENGVKPAFLNVPGPVPFPGNLCISVNDEILHGIPLSQRAFQSGDIVKLDFGIIYKGFYTDHCVSVGLGEVSEGDLALLKIGQMAVWKAASQVAPGVTTGELGHTMQSVAELAGFNVLKEYIGHGIGASLWEAPEIPAYGKPGRGSELQAGMVLCVEAQTVAGSDQVFVDRDGWTIKTKDHKRGVMFEYMVLVTEKGHDILTQTQDWALVK